MASLVFGSGQCDFLQVDGSVFLFVFCCDSALIDYLDERGNSGNLYSQRVLHRKPSADALSHMEISASS